MLSFSINERCSPTSLTPTIVLLKEELEAALVKGDDDVLHVRTDCVAAEVRYHRTCAKK